MGGIQGPRFQDLRMFGFRVQRFTAYMFTARGCNIWGFWGLACEGLGFRGSWLVFSCCIGIAVLAPKTYLMVGVETS